MNFEISLELLLMVFIQLIVLISFLVSYKERVKRLEIDMEMFKLELGEIKKVNKSLTTLETKVDLLLHDKIK